MNAIVVIALKRPYTFVVLAILILLFGAMSVFKTPTDIFPPIKIPVVAAIWTYNGLMPVRHVGPRRLLLRAHPDHDGQQHRAYREPVAITAAASSRSSSSPEPTSRPRRRRSRPPRRP